jgi:hypothetical protein
VTTVEAAAASRIRKSATIAAFTALLGLGLGGCETSSSLFNASSPDPAATTLAEQAPPAAREKGRVAIAPVIGAPDAIAKQMQAGLGSALAKQSIATTTNVADKVEYTLRGYVVSAREKTGTKISYIWDVTDPAGKRVNRITGEELVAGQQARDPWASVTPQVVDTISTKTASSLATWLPTQSAAAPAVASNSAAKAPAPTAVAAPVQTAAAPAVAPTPTPAPEATTTTGSIAKDGPVTAIVPAVTGAPGDGGVSLTSALQRELSRGGVALATKSTPQTYKVEGKVQVSAGKDGKQPIQIDWNVKDPAGKHLGTVSQKNEIPQGSLDGAWGKTADAAAAAAAQGILKLLNQGKATN